MMKEPAAGLLTVGGIVGYIKLVMPIITIPKSLKKGDSLVVITRKEYEEYLYLRKIIPEVKMTVAEKRSWKRAERDYKNSKYMTLKEFQGELGIVS